jgi:hypothetical protein
LGSDSHLEPKEGKTKKEKERKQKGKEKKGKNCFSLFSFSLFTGFLRLWLVVVLPRNSAARRSARLSNSDRCNS